MALRSFADGALFAEVFGGRPPRVLALHGWGRRGADFKESLRDLPALAPDLPGFGSSPVPESVIGAQGYADIVSKLLGAFDRPPVLVGHSFGGRVAVCLAAKHPEQVGDLVLTGVPLLRQSPPGKPKLVFRIVRKMNDFGLISDRRLEAEKKRRGSIDYRAADGVMRDILVKVVNEGYQDQMPLVESHVHLIWGNDDSEVRPSVARIAHERFFPDSSLEVLPGVGHHVPLQAPADLRRAVEAAL